MNRQIASTTPPPHSLLTSMRYFAWSRLLIACLLGGWFLWSGTSFSEEKAVWGQWTNLQFLAMNYAITGAFFVVLMLKTNKGFTWQVGGQILSDLAFMGAMLFANQAHRLALAPILIFPIAGSAILLPRLWSICIAAVSSLIVQSHSLWGVWILKLETTLFVQAGIHGLIYFGTAFIVSHLAHRTIKQEMLALLQADKIRRQQHINRLIINDMEIGVAIIQPDGYLSEINPAAQKLLGVEAHQDGILDMPPASLNEAYQAWLDAPEKNNIRLSIATSEQGTQHTQVKFLSSDPTIPRETDTIIFIENLRRTENRAQELKLASMGRLTASIAHEIRNPLSAIRHAGALLREEIPNNLAEQKLCKIIELNTQRINSIIEDILALSRKGPINTTHICIQSFLDELMEELQPEFGTRLHLKIEFKEKTFILADQNHLRQILVNLTSNALRYASGLTSSIVVHLENKHNTLHLGIADDGPGIAKDQLPNLFEPFFTTEQKGLGLGLYLARELCSANNIALRYIYTPKWHIKAKGAFELSIPIDHAFNLN
jgi:two-component system, NtrC family, sensor histidine kinase PilS